MLRKASPPPAFVDDGDRRRLGPAWHRRVRGLHVLKVKGSFEADEAVEIAGPDGVVFAKGLCRLDAAGLREVAGLRTFDLPEGITHEVVHRDDLVVLP